MSLLILLERGGGNTQERREVLLSLCISQFQLHPAPPPPHPQATVGHLPTLSVPGVGHLKILHCPGAGHLQPRGHSPTAGPFPNF